MLETPKALDTIIFKQTKNTNTQNLRTKHKKNYFISENSNGCYNGQSAGNQKFYTF